MKKIFVLSLLILAFAATAYSQPKLDFRASGFISVTATMFQWNLDNQFGNPVGIINGIPSRLQPNGGEWNRTISYVEERGRLKFDAIMGKELSGTIFFEMDSAAWGDDPSSGAGQGAGRNRIGNWSGDRSGVEVKNLYFDVAVPYVPIPITVRAGLQPYGTRSNMFWYTDGTGITVGAKIDPVDIRLMWAKALEGKMASTDDVDVYALGANAKIDKLTVGGYGVFFNCRQYPMNTSLSTTPYGSTAASMDARFWWLGAYVDGKMGPVMLNFDFIYDWGDVKDRLHGYPKVKYSGFATRLKLDFPWEAFNLGAVGAYGSGADARKTGQFGMPGAPVTDPNYADAGAVSTKVGSFIVPFGSETGSFNDDEIIFGSYANDGFTGMGYNNDGTRVTKGSIGGFWFAKLYGSYKLTPDFKVTLQGLYIGDNTKNGNTMGTAQDCCGNLKNGNSVGWELNLISEWQVYKNLTWRLGAGYLWAGDALEFWNANYLKNEKPDNPWILTTKMIYSF